MGSGLCAARSAGRRPRRSWRSRSPGRGASRGIRTEPTRNCVMNVTRRRVRQGLSLPRHRDAVGSCSEHHNVRRRQAWPDVALDGFRGHGDRGCARWLSQSRFKRASHRAGAARHAAAAGPQSVQLGQAVGPGRSPLGAIQPMQILDAGGQRLTDWLNASRVAAQSPQQHSPQHLLLASCRTDIAARNACAPLTERAPPRRRSDVAKSYAKRPPRTPRRNTSKEVLTAIVKARLKTDAAGKCTRWRVFLQPCDAQAGMAHDQRHPARRRGVRAHAENVALERHLHQQD
jgi:hypothetical protein